jgi:hypothetical protein
MSPTQEVSTLRKIKTWAAKQPALLLGLGALLGSLVTGVRTAVHLWDNVQTIPVLQAQDTAQNQAIAQVIILQASKYDSLSSKLNTVIRIECAKLDTANVKLLDICQPKVTP